MFFANFNKTINDQQRYSSVDLFRAAAVISVLLTHFGKFVPYFYKYGGLGVDLFFVISGFLITNSLTGDLSNQKPVSYKKFLLKRAFKILPSYYFFLLFGYIFSILFIKPIAPEQVPLLKELPQYIFFYRNYGGPPERLAFDHIWSLCVEEHFYLSLPLLFIVVPRLFKKDIYLLYFIAAFIALIWLLKIIEYNTMVAEYPSYSHNRFDALGLGVLLSLFIHFYKDKIYFLTRNIYLFTIASALLISAMALTSNLSDFSQFFFLNTFAPLCFAIMMLSLLNYRFTGLKPIKFIAYCSYNLYLWHFIFIIPVIYYFGDSWKGFLIYAAISFLMAILTTKYIEEKALSLRAKILH